MLSQIALIFLQSPDFNNYEDLGLKSILISIILILVFAVGYIYKEKNKEIKEKDAKISEIIKNHQDDLKEGVNDYKSLLDKYHEFTRQIKEIVNARNSVQKDY